MPRDVVLSTAAWKDLQRVNLWVNSHVKPITDMDHWGVVERWNYPDDGYGDCEDYVLLKRKMLIDAGWPREALLITVVRDKKGEGHAVLTVKSDKGEFVLDNQNENVVAWTETGYRFVKRQRHRCSRRVAVAIHGDDHLVAVDTEFPASRIDDADIGLMRNQPVDVVGRHGIGAKSFRTAFGHGTTAVQ